MPRHQQVTTCRKSDGPISKFCTCEHCSLSVCSVCGAYEGSLTTDCPGAHVDFDKQQEVYETKLDYTDERGWHQGEPTKQRSPRFETYRFRGRRRLRMTEGGKLVEMTLEECTEADRQPPASDPLVMIDVNVEAGVATFAPEGVPKSQKTGPLTHAPLLSNQKIKRIVSCTCGWRVPRDTDDSDDAYAMHAALAKCSPEVDWAAIHLSLDLQHELVQKAVAWALSDHLCEDHSAALTRIEDEIGMKLEEPDEHGQELLKKLEYEQIGFRLADQRAQKCDDEFRQAARKLVAALTKEPA